MMHCVGTASESDAPIMGDLPNQTVPLAPVPLARQQGGLPLFRVQTRVRRARGGLVLVLVPDSPATLGQQPIAEDRPAPGEKIFATVNTALLMP